MRSVFSRVSVLAYVLVWLVSIPAPAADERIILVVGDSLSAGYGMQLDESWPSLLENRLEGNGQRYRVVNASITGETTQGGRARLSRLLEKYRPVVVIIELGGNDGLRGFSLAVTRANLSAMVEQSQAAGARVVLTGIVLPPNYGPAYADRFQSMYGEIAGQYDTLLVPFFMDGVALVEGMMQGDGIHPSAEAQPVLLDNVWRVLESTLTVVP